LILFFPPCGFEPAMLEESVSNHGHERVAVEAVPGSPLEVVETQFFFQLLVSLLANPSRLDGGRQGAQVRLRWQVGEIVFLLVDCRVSTALLGIAQADRCPLNDQVGLWTVSGCFVSSKKCRDHSVR